MAPCTATSAQPSRRSHTSCAGVQSSSTSRAPAVLHAYGVAVATQGPSQPAMPTVGASAIWTVGHLQQACAANKAQAAVELASAVVVHAHVPVSGVCVGSISDFAHLVSPGQCLVVPLPLPFDVWGCVPPPCSAARSAFRSAAVPAMMTTWPSSRRCWQSCTGGTDRQQLLAESGQTVQGERAPDTLNGHLQEQIGALRC